MTRLLTTGHSNVELVHVVRLLHGQGVEVLIDVRSHPKSRFAPQFNRAVLDRGLAAHGIGYVFGGHELGGRPHDTACYDEQGYVLYGRQSRTPAFTDGIKRLETVAQDSRTAIMCS